MKSESVSPTKSNSKSKKNNGQLIDQILAQTKAQLKVKNKALLNGPSTTTTSKSVKRTPVNKQNLISELVTQELDELSKKRKRHSKELNSDVVTLKKIKVEKVSEDEYSHTNNLRRGSTFLDTTKPIKNEKDDNYRSLSKERDELEKLFSNSTQTFHANSTLNANQKSPKVKLSDLSISRISKCGNTGSSSESEVPVSKPKKRKSSSSVNNTPNLKAIKEEIKSEDEVTIQSKVAIGTEEPVKENSSLAHHHSDSSRSDNEPEDNRDRSLNIITSLESDLLQHQTKSNRLAKVSPQKGPNSKLMSISRNSNVSSKFQKKHNKAQLSQLDNTFGSSSDESNLPRSLETKQVLKRQTEPVHTKTKSYSESESESEEATFSKLLKDKQVKQRRNTQRKNISLPVPLNTKSTLESESEQVTFPKSSQVTLKRQQIKMQGKKISLPVPLKTNSTSDSESDSERVLQAESKKQQNHGMHGSVHVPIKASLSADSESDSDYLTLPKPLLVKQEKSEKQKKYVSVPVPIKSRQSSDSESGSEELTLPKPLRVKQEKSNKQKNNVSVPVPIKSRPSSDSQSSSEELALPKPILVKQEKSRKQKNLISVPVPIKSRPFSDSEEDFEERTLPKPLQVKQEKSKKQKSDVSVPLPIKSRPSSDLENCTVPKPLQVKQEKSRKQKKHVSVPVPIRSDSSSHSDSDSQSLNLPTLLPVKERKSQKQIKHVSVPVPIRSDSSSHSDSDSQSLNLPKPLPVKERKPKKESKNVSVPVPIKTRQSSGSDSSSEELTLPKSLQMQQDNQTTRKKHVLISQRSKPDLPSSSIEKSTGFQKITSEIERQKPKSRKEQVPVVAKEQHPSDSESSSEEEEPLSQKKSGNKHAAVTNQSEISDEDSDNDPSISRSNHNNTNSYVEDGRSAASGEQEASDSDRSRGSVLSKSLPSEETLHINYKDTSDGSSSEDEDAHFNTSIGNKSSVMVENENRSKQLLGSSKASMVSNRIEEKASSSSNDDVPKPIALKPVSVNLTKAKRQRQKSESSDASPPNKRLRKETGPTHIPSTSSKVKASSPMVADRKHAYRSSLHEEATVAKPVAAEWKSPKNLLHNNESRQFAYESSDSEHALPMRNTISDKMSWIEKLNLNFPGIEQQQIETQLPKDNAKYSLLLVPKHINPSSLVNLKCHLNKETLVSLNNMEYVFQPLPKKPDPAIININAPKLVELESVIYFQQLVPQLPLNEVTVPVRERIMLPSEIKSRHPLFGANYKKQIRLGIEVKRKLQKAVERKQKVAEKERIKRKTKRKLIVGGVEENVLSIFNSITTTGDVATDVEAFPVKVEDSSFTKASKSKHNHENGSFHANEKAKRKNVKARTDEVSYNDKKKGKKRNIGDDMPI